MIIETQDKKIIDTEKENSDLQALVAEDLHTLYLKYAKLGISFYAVVPPDQEKNIQGFFTRHLQSRNGLELFRHLLGPISQDLLKCTNGDFNISILHSTMEAKLKKLTEEEL